MTITKNTIIAEILNNDPTQGCANLPVHRYTAWAAWLPMARPLRRPAPSTVLTPTLWSPS